MSETEINNSNVQLPGLPGNFIVEIIEIIKKGAELGTSKFEEVKVLVESIADSNMEVVSSVTKTNELVTRTNELLTMSLYLFIVFFVFFALHRFSQAKRRK